jgi:two-component system sensor histidine kinase/response regulator
LRQVLLNLIGNAVKFTASGEVGVTVLLDSVHDNQFDLSFAVRDTGIGIPKEKQSAVFEPFSQADGSTTRKFGGTGLGLTISTRLVRLMGGSIWLESEPGQGSCFHFSASFGAATETEPPEANESPLAGAAVLVVDDNAVNCRILTDLLRQWHLRPVAVAGGREALAALRQACERGDPFRLVLTDCHMPEMDGFDLTGRIRTSPHLAEAVVMMLSSGVQTGDLQRCRDLGIGVHLTKPVRRAELKAVILKALGRERNPRIDPRPAVAEIPTAPESSNDPAMDILLAEDNVVNQRVALRILEKRGHRVVVANNGVEALKALHQQDFDVVLMDVQMPEMGGFEAARKIRERERGGRVHIPIIAMTAHAMNGDRERCLEAGMDDYISKPIRAAALLELLGRYRRQPVA